MFYGVYGNRGVGLCFASRDYYDMWELPLYIGSFCFYGIFDVYIMYIGGDYLEASRRVLSPVYFSCGGIPK